MFGYRLKVLSRLMTFRFSTIRSEQTGTEALEALIAGKEVLVILATDLGKSILYQMFFSAKILKACVLVISSLYCIVVEQVDKPNALGLPVVQSSEKVEDYIIFEDKLRL